MSRREVENIVTISGQIHGETLQGGHRKFTMNDPQITMEKVIFNRDGRFRTIQLSSIRRKDRPDHKDPLISTITIKTKVCLEPRANHVVLQTIWIVKKMNGYEARNNYNLFDRRDVHALKNLVKEFILERYGQIIKEKILEPLPSEGLVPFVNLVKLRGGDGESAEDEEEAQDSANVEEPEELKGVEAYVVEAYVHEEEEEANDIAVIKEPEELEDDAEATEDQENDAQYCLWMLANVNLDQTQDPAKYTLSHRQVWVSPISYTGDYLVPVTLLEEPNTGSNSMPDFAVSNTWMVKVTRDDHESVSKIDLRDHKGKLLGAEVPIETKWAIFRLAAEYLQHHRQELKDTIDQIRIVRFSGNDFEGNDGQYNYFISPTEMPHFPLCDTTKLMKIIAEEHMEMVDRQEDGYPWLRIHGMDEFELLYGLAALGITGSVIETNGKLFRIRDDEDESESDADVSELNITSSVNETGSKIDQKEETHVNAFASEYDRVLRHLRQDCGEDGALQEEDNACLCGSCPLLDPCGEGK